MPVIRIIFEHPGPTQRRNQVFERNIFLHHFLMRMGGDAKSLNFSLVMEAVRYLIEVSLTRVRHSIRSYNIHPYRTSFGAIVKGGGPVRIWLGSRSVTAAEA